MRKCAYYLLKSKSIPENDISRFCIHAFDYCKAFNANALRPDFVAPMLIAFFDYRAAANKFGAAFLNHLNKAAKRVAHCKKIINNKHIIAFTEKAL